MTEVLFLNEMRYDLAICLQSLVSSAYYVVMESILAFFFYGF